MGRGIPQRRELELYLIQARSDLKTAEDNLDMGHYDACALFSQQSVEKALKALYIKVRRSRVPLTHSLLELGKDLSAPATLATALSDLTTDYLTSRYPSAANGAPSEVYTKERAVRSLDSARKVWKWIEPQL